MKNVKRLVAILTTAVLCMGMGMSTMAAQSQADSNDVFWSPETLQKVGTVGSVVDTNGNPVEYVEKTLSSQTMSALSDESKVKEIFQECGFEVTDNMDLVPIYTGGIILDGGLGSSTVAVFPVGSAGLKAGNPVYAMRETYAGSGEFEIIEGTVDAEGEVRFNMTANGQSFVLVKVLDDGSLVTIVKKTGGIDVNSEVKEDNADTGVAMEKAVTTVKDANGNEIKDKAAEVRVSKIAPQIDKLLNDVVDGKKGYENIFAEKYNYPENSEVELVYKGEFDLVDVETQLKTTGTATIYFSVEEKNVEEGKKINYYAIHFITNENGTIIGSEILECKKDEATGQMYFTMDSFSPVAIIRVMSDETPTLIAPTKPGSGGSGSSSNKSGSGGSSSSAKLETAVQQGAAGQSGTTIQISSSDKASPKTGEF